MDVACRQKFLLAHLEPASARVALASWTMPVSTCNGVHTIMQSIFSVAARRCRMLATATTAKRRAGALKMGWTEPPHEACPMCIEWLA
jgi:hypothetical protein